MGDGDNKGGAPVPASLELERYLVHLIAARGLVMLEKALPQAMNQGGDHTHAHR